MRLSLGGFEFAVCFKDGSIFVTLCHRLNCASFTLCSSLLFHRFLHGGAWVDILDFDRFDRHTPVSDIIDDLLFEFGFDMLTVAQRLIKRHLPKDRTQGGHDQLLDRQLEVLDTIECIFGLGDTDEGNCIGGDNSIVASDDLLLRDIEDDVTCRDLGAYSLDIGDDEIEPRLESTGEFPQSFDDPFFTLRNDIDPLVEGDDDEYSQYDDDIECFHIFSPLYLDFCYFDELTNDLDDLDPLTFFYGMIGDGDPLCLTKYRHIEVYFAFFVRFDRFGDSAEHIEVVVGLSGVADMFFCHPLLPCYQIPGTQGSPDQYLIGECDRIDIVKQSHSDSSDPKTQQNKCTRIYLQYQQKQPCNNPVPPEDTLV